MRIVLADVVSARETFAPGTPRVSTASAAVAALASATVIVALFVFYAVEVTAPQPHVWGPISDMGTACWDLVAAPLLWGVGLAVLGDRRIGVLVSGGAALLSVLGAAASVLLVVRVLPFEISTTVSVLVLLAQCCWLFLVGRGMRRTAGWRPRTARLAAAAGAAQIIGATIAALSLLLGWGSGPQIAVMAVGVVPGLLGWAAWPVWFALLGLDLRRAPVSGRS